MQPESKKQPKPITKHRGKQRQISIRSVMRPEPDLEKIAMTVFAKLMADNRGAENVREKRDSTE